MGRHYCDLKLDERRKLAMWLGAKMSVSEITDRLGRPPAIYRDISRTDTTGTEMAKLNDYHALVAQDKYEQRHAIHPKLIRHTDFLRGSLDGSPVRSLGLVVVFGRIDAGRPKDAPQFSNPKLSVAAADCRTGRSTRLRRPSACPRLLPARETIAETLAGETEKPGVRAAAALVRLETG